MGLSSSKSTTKTDQKQTANEVTSGTTTPIAPEWLTGVAQDYVGRIGEFGAMDPYSFVASPSPLQEMAWNNVGKLSGWQGQASTAAGLANNVGQAGPNMIWNTAQADTRLTGNTANARPTAYAPPSLGNPYGTDWRGYNTPTLRDAPLVEARGYEAPQLADARGYAAARNGAPIGATAAQVSERMGAYQNPFQQQVIDTTLAQLDRSGQQQGARLAAEGARRGAFGGSRFGIAEGQLAADLALGRASAEAGLRSQGFNTAAQLAGQDAGYSQQASLFNADSRNRFALDQAGREDMASQFGASATNQRNLAQGGFEVGARQFGADAANRSQALNQSALMQRDFTQAGLQADANRFGADAANRASLFDSQSRNQFDLERAGMQERAGQFYASAANQADLYNAGAQNQANQFNADALNRASLFNAGENNRTAGFNAGQQESALQRQLQAASLLQQGAGQYAGDTRADLGLMAGLGDQQRGIESAYARAPWDQLAGMGMLGQFPMEAFFGRSVNGTTDSTGTLQGTNVTKQSPSLFNALMGGVSLFA
jgi:hypothetical protein